jgi:hypothetical protein
MRLGVDSVPKPIVADPRFDTPWLERSSEVVAKRSVS